MIRKKKTSKKKDNETKPSSCSILVNVPHDNGRKTFVGLIDTGTSASLANAKAVRYCKKDEKKKETDWSTQGGAFATKKKATITGVKFPQFTKNRSLEFAMHLFEKKKNDKYDFILGRDLLQTVGIDILNSTGTLRWDDIEIKMMPSRMARDLSTNELEEIFTAKRERNTKILDAEYTKPDLKEIAATQEHLTGLQREAFLKLLEEKEAAFMGVRGTWNGDPVEFKLKKDKKKPFYTKPYLIPKSLYATTRKEVDRLEKEVGLLTKRTDLKYLSACFVIPKKDGTVRFITDFRKLNTMIVRTPFPLPNIQETLATIGKFTYASTVDLIMGYYHMVVHERVKKYLGIVLPWGTYVYNYLPMGLCVASDVFQSRLGQLFLDMENVLIYIDDVLVVTHGSFEEHLRTLGKVIDRLIAKGMQVNARKCEWFKSEVEYLGYVIDKQGVRPQKSKVAKILQIKEPTSAKGVRSFLGLVNYYRYMWKQRSTLIAPLTELSTKGKRKFIWTEKHAEAFRKIKKIVAKETLLVYPDFTKAFDVHTDSSDYQLGGVVSQGQKPIAFFSRKLNSAQRNYTVTEKELLAIVETLKEFRYILYGHKIIVHTDHKNLCSTTAQHEGQRVMRQRLVMEEFGIEIKYIEGSKNNTADALSRL